MLDVSQCEMQAVYELFVSRVPQWPRPCA